MKISIFGAGPVGLITSLCFAEAGHQVVCVDVDQSKIDRLKNAEAPFYEPGLPELLKRQIEMERITFTVDAQVAITHADLIFLAVNTPTINSHCDLGSIETAIEQIIADQSRARTILIKSTVPPGTHLKYKEKYQRYSVKFISNPEFIREGHAISDVRNPDRIVLGLSQGQDIELIKNIYRPFIKSDEQLILMDPTSAELTKYAANIMLASRISLMNEISRLSERVGADIESVRRGVGSDHRIGSEFLRAGLGYGGSCFPKDTEALVSIAKSYGEEFNLTRAVADVNVTQIQRFAQKIITHAKENKLNTLSLWGVTFKPLSNDLREAPALKVISRLLESGLKLQIFDPVAGSDLAGLFGNNPLVTIYPNQYECLKNSDALVIMTEWDEFARPNFEHMKLLLRTATIFDGRNIYDPIEMRKLQFSYFSIGRPQ
ncbi:MAG: UDP-glucose/GDP-mannose dehydrogenase family protein [Bdellovibrionaceae bacterium]|nr:UDP-glucose/GDP-mannose dehydrogenase family protein [Bdellovibrio sp.]